MSEEVHPTNKFCLEAIDRIARTPDGAALYVFFATPPDADFYRAD